MQRWTCPNCSYGNGMHQHQCSRCRFEPVGLDLTPSPGSPAMSAPQSPPESRGARVVDMVLLGLLALLAGWLAWTARTVPLTAKVPFALYILACTWVAIWILQVRRRVRRT